MQTSTKQLLALLALLLSATSSAPVLAAPSGGQGRHDDFIEASMKLRSEPEPRKGEIRFKKDQVEWKEAGRVRKFAPGDIEWFEEILREPPPTDLQIAEAQKLYIERKGRVKVDDATSWLELGAWCQSRGLNKEAREALTRSIELDPNQPDARRKLGYVKEGSDWFEVRELAQTRFARLDTKNIEDLAKFGEWAAPFQLKEGFDALDKALQLDLFHARSLRAMARYTSRYVHSTALRFPLAGRWYADLDKTRHHQKKAYAVYALDLSKVDEKGRRNIGSGKKLTDYFTWDEPVYAVADGVVVDARDGQPDLEIGAPARPEQHNGLAIRHQGGEHSFYVHLKKASLTVKLGDPVKAGQIIARVGNSGGTYQPHLHFTMAIPTAISIPWAVDDFDVLVGEIPVRCRRGRPREGQTLTATVPVEAGSGSVEPKKP